MVITIHSAPAQERQRTRARAATSTSTISSNATEEAQPNKKARQMGQQKMTDFFTKK